MKKRVREKQSKEQSSQPIPQLTLLVTPMSASVGQQAGADDELRELIRQLNNKHQEKNSDKAVETIDIIRNKTLLLSIAYDRLIITVFYKLLPCLMWFFTIGFYWNLKFSKDFQVIKIHY